MPPRNECSDNPVPAPLIPGQIEEELGVPFAGVILEQEQWAKTAIKKLPPEGPIDWSTYFGRKAPLILDIGCGNGRFILTSAIAKPEADHLGIDILPVVIRYATRRGNQRGLHNTRFVVCGGFTFLDRYMADASLDEIHIYHPQPYHSPHQIHLRMLTPDFLALVHRKLQHEGKMYLQTDNAAYWEYIRNTVPKVFEWSERTEPWEQDPLGRTRREIVARSEGLTIYRGIAIRNREIESAEMAHLLSSMPKPSFQSERSEQARPLGNRYRNPRRRR